MKITASVFLLFAIGGMQLAFAQADINYQPSALIKEIRKATGSNQVLLEEIMLPETVNTDKQINGKYFVLKGNQSSQYQYVYVGRVLSCRAGGCSINTIETGDSEYFDYFILFNSSKVVQLVKVFNYQATHGQEITARGWLKQFIGHDGSQHLQVGKGIDAIAGATISVYAITMDIEKKAGLAVRCIKNQD